MLRGFTMNFKIFISICILSLCISGCNKQEKTSDAHNHSHHTDIVLCGGCGQVKGTEDCCIKDAIKCSCGAIKGSPGCCQITFPGDDITLCSHCGEIKGLGFCCDDTAIKCDKCRKIKGSPGCCIVSAHTH